jgi:hypothetical protein
MKEQFDKRLVDKIKVSFEQLEEPLDPREFEKFEKLYFGRKNKVKKISAFWWMGIAASSVLGILIFSQLLITEIDQDESISEVQSSNAAMNLDDQSLAEDKSVDEEINLKSRSALKSDPMEKVKQKITNYDPANRGSDKLDSEVVQNNDLTTLHTIPIIAGKNESAIEFNLDSKSIQSFIDSQKKSPFDQASQTEQKTLDYIKNWLGDESEIESKQTMAKIAKRMALLNLVY